MLAMLSNLWSAPAAPAAMVGMVWQPVISPLHIFGAAGLLAALAIFAYARTFREHRLASLGLLAMRGAVIAVLAVLLMGPSTIPPVARKPGRAKLLVLADTSASMLTEDCQGMSRMAFAQRTWLDKANLEKISQTYDVRYFGFDGDLHPLAYGALQRPADELATGRVSRIDESLRKALQRVRSGRSEAALLVISDGHDSDDRPMQPVALLAKARGIAVHTVCLGGPTLRRDLLLVALPEQEFLLADEKGHIVVKVHQAGLDQAETTLHLRCGQEHVTRTVRFRGRDSVTLRLPVQQAKSGLYEYKLSVDSVTGETEQGNNAQSVFLGVTEQDIKVLVLEGEPFWDTKFLVQSLRKDARIEMTQITQLSDSKQEKIVTRTDRPGTELPTTAREFAEYDVVILGRGVERLLDAETAALLPDYVSSQGGHVIFARGRAYDPDTPRGRRMGRDLAVLEPVVWGRGLSHNLSLAVTPIGRSSPCFALAGIIGDIDETIASLPGFTVMPVVVREKTATLVLARAQAPGRAHAGADTQAPPALVCMNYGRGRVVAVLGEGLWRWSFLPPHLSRLDGVYDTFWSNMIRWLAMGSEFLPGEEASLKLSRSSIRLGDPVLLDVACKFVPAGGIAAKLTVVDPAGKSHEVLLQQVAGVATRLQGTFTAERAGVHNVLLDCPQFTPKRIEKKFSIYHVDFETLQTSARPKAMRTLAEQSGGLFLAHDEAENLPEELAQLRALREAPHRPRYVWDKGLLLLVVLLWAGAEWLIRRKAGLL